MELTLTASSTTRVTVTCDDHLSHAFTSSPLFLPKNDVYQEIPPDDPRRYGELIFAALFPLGSSARQALDANPEWIVLVADQALQAIPWEYAHHEHNFLATEIPIVRGLPRDRAYRHPGVDTASAAYSGGAIQPVG